MNFVPVFIYHEISIVQGAPANVILILSLGLTEATEMRFLRSADGVILLILKLSEDIRTNIFIKLDVGMGQ